VIDFVFANVNIQVRVLELRVEERVELGPHADLPEAETRREGKKRRKIKRETLQQWEGEEYHMLGYRGKERILEKKEQKNWKEDQEKKDGI